MSYLILKIIIHDMITIINDKEIEITDIKEEDCIYIDDTSSPIYDINNV